jgi:hypothetical protein
MKARAANAIGAQVAPMLEVLQGAVDAGLCGGPDERAEVETLVADGRRHVELLTLSVHGQAPRDGLDKKGLRTWTSRATDEVPELAERVAAAGWFGPAMHTHELVCTGVRGTGTVVGIQDGHVTLQNDPRLAITIEVHPVDGPPYEVRRDVTVSRVRLPRVGDAVEVAWAQGDPGYFAYRVVPAPAAPASAARPAADRLEQLRQLGDLRASGVLSDSEFETEKQRILDARG